jgi:hypothetical protein
MALSSLARRASAHGSGLSFSRIPAHRQPVSGEKDSAGVAGDKVISVMVPVAVEAPYTYRAPAGMDLAPGDIVAVPLGTRDVLGVVWDDPPDPSIGHNRLRPVA